jgi:hypothetical protein
MRGSDVARVLTEFDVEVKRGVVVGCDCALVGIRGSSCLSAQGAGFRVQGAGCMVQGAGCRVQGSGRRV